MFNQIYKTLKNLNDELITKKKKLQAQKRISRQQSRVDLTDTLKSEDVVVI